MQHKANMSNRSLICSGYKVNEKHMSADDLAWATQFANVIAKDDNGNYYHTKITDRDRKYRENYWNPDTGPWRKGVNY